VKLKKLDLANNKFTCKGILHFFQTLKQHQYIKLTHLSLDKSNLEDSQSYENLRSFNKLLQLLPEFIRNNKHLVSLSLQNCGIQNKFMQQIGKGLIGNEKLQFLHLKGNSIEGEGLMDLYDALKENQHLVLKLIDLSQNKLNDEAGL